MEIKATDGDSSFTSEFDRKTKKIKYNLFKGMSITCASCFYYHRLICNK